MAMSWTQKRARGQGKAWLHKCEITGRESLLRRDHLYPYSNGCPDCHTNPEDLPEAFPCNVNNCPCVYKTRDKLLNHVVRAHIGLSKAASRTEE